MKKDESRIKRDLIAEVEELRGLITHHRETEARLRETEELYRNLADSSPVGLYLLVQGKFHFLNAQFERSTGYRADELIGRDALFMVHPEDRETVRRDAIEMLKGKRTSPYEFRTITKDGRTRWILGTVASIPFWGKRAVLGNHMDISEQKEARRRLEELEALEASILDALPVAVIVLRERKILFANGAVETVFGWKPDELVGRGTRILYRSDDEYEEIGRHFYPVLERQRIFSEEFPCRHRDGRDILCFVSTSRIGANLEEKRIVATYEDITTIVQSILRAIDGLGMDLDDFVFVSGIGCAAWIPSPFFNADVLHTTHGRPIAFCFGIKMGLPEKKVMVVSGDGDLVAIGGNHLIQNARRNVEMVVLCVNNGIYGMTGGQAAPTTPMGIRTTTTPYGTVENTFNISRLVAASGASFVGCWTTAHPKQLTNSIKKAIHEEGVCLYRGFFPVSDPVWEEDRGGQCCPDAGGL